MNKTQQADAWTLEQRKKATYVPDNLPPPKPELIEKYSEEIRSRSWFKKKQ